MKDAIKYWREVIIISLLIWGVVTMGKLTECESIVIPENNGDIIPKMSIELVQELAFNDLTFNSAFGRMHGLYGEGHVFDWRGDLYTTNLKDSQE